jgi:hypothetical protein
MKRAWLFGVLILLLLGLLGGWVYTHLVKEQVVVTRPGSAEARRNPLLAAQRLLQRLGRPVESVRGSARLPGPAGPDDTVVLYATHTPFGAARLQRLLDWVAGGGRLVMDVEGLWDAQRKATRSRLLQRLGVRMTTCRSRRCIPALSQRLGVCMTTLSDPPTGPVPVTLDGESMQIDLDPRHAMIDDSGRGRHLADIEGGTLMLAFSHGRGRIYLVNDLGFLDNQQIGQHDHAYFLARLAEGGGTLWLFHSPHAPSLARLLWRHAWPLLLTLALFGLAGWRHGNRRIAPLLPPPPAANRDIGEHLDALGRFDERHGLLPERVRQTQRWVEQHWLTRHPHLAGLDHAARAAWIAAHTGHTPEKITHALYTEPSDTTVFTRHSALLQQLWRQA